MHDNSRWDKTRQDRHIHRQAAIPKARLTSRHQEQTYKQTTMHTCMHTQDGGQINKHISSHIHRRQTCRQLQADTSAHAEATTNQCMTIQDGTRLDKTGTHTYKQPYPKPVWQAYIKNRHTNKPPCINACTHKQHSGPRDKHTSSHIDRQACRQLQADTSARTEATA